MDNFRQDIIQLSFNWKNYKNNWFKQSHEFDSYIVSTYGKLLNRDVIEVILKNIDTIDESKYEECLIFGCIIVCDQISRHIYRNPTENEEKIIYFYTELASQFSEKIMYSPVFNTLEKYIQCFILLPFRHLNNIQKMEESLEILFYSKFYINNYEGITKRFYYATLEKLSKYYTQKYLEHDNYMLYNEQIISILDSKSCKSLHPFDFPNKIEHIVKTVEKFIQKHNIQNITISLSGGVDSMVLLYVLKDLREKYKLNLKAIHIDYNNRSTSSLECELCVYFCNLMRIPIYVRSIYEIARSKEHREFYEKITRNIRFDCYEKLKYGVALAHNYEDTLENILTNIIKQQNFDNLKGMQETHFDKVPIYRPFLNISKQQIYDFAHKYKIPFVYDSTPKWSDRGKLRDILIPIIKEFDPRMIEGLIGLSNYTLNTGKINQEAINYKVNYLCDKIQPNKNEQIAIIQKDILENDIFIWKNIMKNLCKKYKVHYISKKSIDVSFQLMKKIQRQKIITLNTRMYIKINDNIEIYYNSCK